MRDASRSLKSELKDLEPQLAEIQEKRDGALASLPNIPDPEAPDGMTEEDAVTIREVGERPQFDFEPLDHLELGQRHGWIEMEAAAETSGSRFAYLLGDLVVLELALVRFAMETLRSEGFPPAAPPVLVREQALLRHRLLPRRARDDLRDPARRPLLVGTSEVSLASLHADQIMDAEELPRRYAGFSTCFRREAGPPAAIRAGSSVSTSSTRSRCSASSSRATRARSTSGSSPCRSGSSARSRSPTGWSTSRSAISARRPLASSIARRGFQARSDIGS